MTSAEKSLKAHNERDPAFSAEEKNILNSSIVLAMKQNHLFQKKIYTSVTLVNIIY